MDPIRFEKDKLYLLDQRLLPVDVVYVECKNWQDVAAGIKDMVVRGAPAIGASAAFGMALAAKELSVADNARFFAGLEEAAIGLKATRPTAINLAWAVERMLNVARTQTGTAPQEIALLLAAEAQRIASEDIAINRKMGDFGAELIVDQARILTHCNAGALATVGYGTALGVIRSAVAQGKQVSVFADETRPYLQGARLTAWELHRENIPVTVIADNMAGFLMKQGKIDLVIVGADRIAANGDVANKVGTYALAVLARHHGVKMMVVAPSSTLDPEMPNGSGIVIEEREPGEIWRAAGMQTQLDGFAAWNPVFDVTPAEWVDCIVTEGGVFWPPYDFSGP